MQTIYRPGHWNTLIVPGALLALPADAPQSLVASLWERLSAERALAAVVDAITESAGGSFTELPPFVAVVLEGADARIAIRGDIVVKVTGSEGTETLSGANVMTWSERFIPGAGRIVLQLADPSDGPELPVIGGVVRAAEIVADIEPGDDAVEPPFADAAAEGGHIISGIGTAADPAPAESDAVRSEPVESEPVESEPVESEPAEAEPEPTAAEPEPAPAEPEPAESTEAEPPAEEPSAPETAEQSEHVGETLIPAEQTIGSDIDEFEQLFGDTVHSAPSAAAASAAPVVPIAGDHDGATISVAEARALRRDVPSVPSAAPDAPTALLPTVGGGRIRVSTGQVVTLDRTVVIGRRPRAPRASGSNLPHLIAVESPQQDISRSHLEIRPEGDTVVVIDLHTTNGSTLLRPGADPVRLHPGEQTLVLTGDVIDLGDGVTVAFEDLP